MTAESGARVAAGTARKAGGPSGLRLAALALAAWSAASAADVTAVQQPAMSRAVLATVVDGRGRALVDLRPDDFIVTEGGERREILDVYAADYPVTVLLDNSMEAAGALADLRSAAVEFVDRLGLRPVAVGTLTDTARLLTSFGDSRAETFTAIAGIQAAPGPAETLPAIAGAARAMASAGPPFSAVVVLSARIGESGGAESVPSFDGRPTIHVVQRRSPADSSGGGAANALEYLARRTGGQYTAIYSAASYAAALDTLADRLEGEMMVEYLTPAASRPVNPARVQIGVAIPGARVNGLGVSR